MLEPDDRALLTDLLRPPPGFTLSQAVGTTFTLDLASALTVPLAFARHDIDDGGITGESLDVFDAIRRAAGKVDVFAQAGYVRPSIDPAPGLLAMLEPMLHPIVMRRGLFHPKVWLVEYSRDDERRFRFVCSSRNLTADHSWDAVVSLDGTADEDTPHAAQNARMSDLLQWLVANASPSLSRARRRHVLDLAERWQHVRWELPSNLSRLDVHVLGVGSARTRDLDTIGASSVERGRRTRRLIVAPFVTDDGVDTIGRGARGTDLIGRAEELERLSPTTLRRLTTWELNPANVFDADGDDASASALQGLHAKIVVTDFDHRARMLVGSANATDPAWRSNVEVMVELEGRGREVGVDALLTAWEGSGFITRYDAVGGARQPEDDAQRAALEDALRRAASTHVAVAVEPDGDDTAAVTIWGDVGTGIPAGVTLAWRLLGSRRAPSGSGWFPGETAPATFAGVSLEDVTPFISLTARDAHGHSASSIVVAELVQDVQDRRDRLVARMIDSPDRFLAFLALVLQDQSFVLPGGVPQQRSGAFGTFAGVDADGNGLFEVLMRAVGRDDDAMRTIDRAMAHVDPAVLPGGFAPLWDAAWRAHRSDHHGGVA